MEPEAPEQVPGVKDTELVAALQGLASVPETSVDIEDRFATEVRAIVERRAQGGWTGEGGSDVAIFLHTIYPREVGGKMGGSSVSNLIASGRPILGKLFFL
jgi:phage protein U